MSEDFALPRWTAGMLGAVLGMGMPALAHGFSAKPDDAQGAKVVGHLLTTNFTRPCDVNTYPLRKNLSYLFDNKYMGLDFRSWEVTPLGGQRFEVVLRYIDGEAGPTAARWEVDLGAQEAELGGENAEVLSCMTGYM